MSRTPNEKVTSIIFLIPLPVNSDQKKICPFECRLKHVRSTIIPIMSAITIMLLLLWFITVRYNTRIR